MGDISKISDQQLIDKNLIINIKEELENIIINSEKIEETKTFKKLNHLMNKSNNPSNFTTGGQVRNFINLFDHILSKEEMNFLNLNINYQVQPKYSKFFK